MRKGIIFFAGLFSAALLVKASFDDINPPTNATELQFQHWINMGLILGAVLLAILGAFIGGKLIKANQRSWTSRPLLPSIPGSVESMTYNVDKDMRKAVGQIALLPDLVEQNGNVKVESLTGPSILIDGDK